VLHDARYTTRLLTFASLSNAVFAIPTSSIFIPWYFLMANPTLRSLKNLVAYKDISSPLQLRIATSASWMWQWEKHFAMNYQNSL
jgi:hypothetical protein